MEKQSTFGCTVSPNEYNRGLIMQQITTKRTPPVSNSPALTRVYAWFAALQDDDVPLLADLLAHGVPVDVFHPLRHTTALMESTRLGRTALVHWLLQHGAAPALLCGLPPGTPLHCAIHRRQWDIANLLTLSMPNVAVLDGYGRTPLHALCMEIADATQPVEIRLLAALLLDKQCPLEALDHEGTTALHHCVIHDALEMARLLLERGANPNALIPDSRVSPLTIAALEQNLAMAELLMQHGADPYQPTRDGVTPISILPALRRMQRFSPTMPVPAPSPQTPSRRASVH